jgi:hypothetical protein
MYKSKKINDFLGGNAATLKVEIKDVFKMKPGELGIIIEATKKKNLGKILLRTTMGGAVIFQRGDFITSITFEGFGSVLVVNRNIKRLAEDMLTYFNGVDFTYSVGEMFMDLMPSSKRDRSDLRTCKQTKKGLHKANETIKRLTAARKVKPDTLRQKIDL